MPYLYNYAGQPWKSQLHVREVMDKLYHATPDGYCGDEDNGQTSAWYVFSAMGFYPVCPATDEYVIGSPLFKKVTVSLENGKQIVLNAANNSTDNLYIQGINFNGKPHNANWFNHSALVQGATIDYNMSAQPNTARGTQPQDAPFSLSK
jgi:predicted alpha-1,2-mannosidase